MNHKISAIINYCTNDYKFIRPGIKQVRKFASQIVVTYTDHFFNGQPEDFSLIKKTIKENPEAEFVKIKYKLIKPPINDFLCRLIPRSTNLRPLYGPHYWACMARFIGYQKVSKAVDYFLFLDADEIVDGKRFREWLDTGKHRSLEAMIFDCYFYFRSPRHQAKSLEQCGLLVKNINISKKTFLSHYDRRNVYRKAAGPKKDHILGLNNKPLIHHYAWARTKKGMLKKVETWGHSQERNWTDLVLKEFSHSFNGTDFLRSYKYRTVKPFVSFS